MLTINTECSEELLPFLDFIKDEVNVKTVKIDKESLRVKSTVKLNFKVVGKRYPNKVKMLSQAIIDSRWQRKKDALLGLHGLQVSRILPTIHGINRDKV